MILELDTSLFNIGDISINQLVFLTLCLNEKHQANHQDVHEFISRISETEIQSLIDQGLVSLTTEDTKDYYKPTKKLISFLNKSEDWFEEFYKVYPVYVVRPDGTKGFLRSNINKCRKQYNSIVGKSKAMHEHLLNCLNFEVMNKTITGKLGYMKTMWKWLTQNEWETLEEQMQYEEQNINSYGTELR